MNTKTLNTYEKLWLANRASHNMALAGPTAFWLASGHRATGKPDPCMLLAALECRCFCIGEFLSASFLYT